MLEDIKKILEVAVWAPSGDNSQPWYFEIENDTIHIFYTPNVDHEILNFRDSGSFIAHGGLVENISIASKQYGYDTEIKLFPNKKDPNQTASITLKHSSDKGHLLFSSIKNRCTNRRMYKNTPLTEEQQKEIFTLKNSLPEPCISLSFIDNPKERQVIGRVSSVMEEIALQHKDLHKIFFKTILWDHKKANEGEKGLHISTLELPLPIQKIFVLLKKWSVMKLFNLIGFHKVAAVGNAKTYASGALTGIVITEQESPESYINVGRVMQRVWLTATKLGLSLQPVTGLLFLAQRVRDNKASMFTEKQVRLIEKSYQKIERVFDIQKNQRAVMLFRVGNADKPTNRTSRRTPDIRKIM